MLYKDYQANDKFSLIDVLGVYFHLNDVYLKVLADILGDKNCYFKYM